MQFYTLNGNELFSCSFICIIEVKWHQVDSINSYHAIFEGKTHPADFMKGTKKKQPVDIHIYHAIL